MTWLDTALVLFVLIHVALGLRQGFVLSLTSLLALLMSASLALFGGPWLAGLLSGVLPWPKSLMALALAILLALAASPVMSMTLLRLSARLPDRPSFQRIDHAMGIVSGALRGLLLGVFLMTVYVALTAQVPASSTLAGSLYRLSEAPMWALTQHVQREFPALVRAPQGWDLLSDPVEAVDELPPDKLGQEMLALVNRERRERDLVELRWDGKLAAIALAHSQDMLARNYFAHEDPEGRAASARAAKGGVTYTILGENLAFARTLAQAHRGLMESPGHRENILRPEFRRLGIGIVRLPPDSRYLPKQAAPPGLKPRTGGYLLITQVFAR